MRKSQIPVRISQEATNMKHRCELRNNGLIFGIIHSRHRGDLLHPKTSFMGGYIVIRWFCELDFHKVSYGKVIYVKKSNEI